MSDKLHHFGPLALLSTTQWVVALPFELEQWIADWQAVRREMLRSVPEPFTRDEWAYLWGFVAGDSLRWAFEQTFGPRKEKGPKRPDRLARPRGPVSVWLPNNVSLLGPLMLVLVSLSGNPVRLKAGSQTEDLTESFLRFARDTVPAGPLADYLREQVRLEHFDRHDSRNKEMAAEAAVRIVFGSDETSAAIDSLPHPVASIAFTFSDRQSEAWIDVVRADEEVLTVLIKVFAIYGQAGCTSPRRVVVLNGSDSDALSIRNRLLELWPKVIRRDVPMHVASENVMARQWAAAKGWDAALAARHGAVLLSGSSDLEPIAGHMALPVIAATAEQAVAQLPANIQTIGHALADEHDPVWLSLLAKTAIKRFVPLARMHHFGAVWDGFAFWRSLFEEVEVGHDRWPRSEHGVVG
jgi:hypothetical protein